MNSWLGTLAVSNILVFDILLLYVLLNSGVSSKFFRLKEKGYLFSSETGNISLNLVPCKSFPDKRCMDFIH